MRIFVGNLSFETGNSELQSMFAAYGEVESAQIVTDRETGRSRGFGFVEMPDTSAAQHAIQALSGNSASGRPLTVNEAKPRNEGGGGGRSWR
jgi:cold-inducible RNA-binding protein